MPRNVIDFLLHWSDKVRHRDPVIPEPTAEPHMFQCSCGSMIFHLLENGYECAHCSGFFSFENIHGSID